MAGRVSRRDVLRLAGMATGGWALAACGVEKAVPTAIPTSTPAPSPTPNLLVGIVADTPLYSGPGDVGFEKVAMLERDTSAAPLARFGDFVKVVVAVEDLSADGWVPLESLDASTLLPKGDAGSALEYVPELGVDAVPWIEQRSVGLECPFVMSSEKDEYDGSGLYGSAMEPGREMRMDFFIKITVPETPGERANGIVLVDSLSNPHRLFFGHANGQWRLQFADQGSAGFDHLMSGSELAEGRAWLHVSADGNVLRYGTPDGREGELRDARVLFAPGGFVKAEVQVAPRSTVEVRELKVSFPPSGKRESDPALQESLGVLARRRGMTFGSPSDAQEPRSARVFAKQAGLMTWNISWRAETELYPGLTAGSANEISFAKANGLKRVRGHTLIGGPFDLVPDWLKNGGYSAEEIEGFTREWITGMVSKYTSVDEWVVVNEALGWKDELDNNVWNRALGVEYIAKACRWAREANPAATLLVNDAEVDRPGARLSFYVETLKRLLDGGMPLDGVGSQFHLKAVNAPSKGEIADALGSLASLGLGVYITELDVNLFGLPGSQEEKWARQAEIYRDVAEAALESGAVRSITTWGLSDKYSWLLLPEFQFLGGGEAPLIFDEEYRPKPGYFALREVLGGV